MIDTVILSIPIEHFHPAIDGYSSIVWNLQSRTSNYEKHVRNPGVADKAGGVYMPRLSLIKRKIRGGKNEPSFVRIEFSAPKLIYGNNLAELEENDFPLVIQALSERLVRLNVSINEKYLSSAPVVAAHFSKNFIITGGYTASGISKELAKVNLNKKFDLNKTDFRNDGQSLQGYTAAHSIVFYDKIADLAQHKKRAIDKDQTSQQRSLFSAIKLNQPSLEILRMEVRLSQKRKLQSVLENMGFTPYPTFRDIFKSDVCQKVVRSYWKTLFREENPFLFELASSSPKETLREIIGKCRKIKAKEAVYLVGLKLLCKDDGGIRDLREMLKTKISGRSWYRISKGISLLNKISRRKRAHSWVLEIDEAIENFEAYKNTARAP